jgi:hypothetical protein
MGEAEIEVRWDAARVAIDGQSGLAVLLLLANQVMGRRQTPAEFVTERCAGEVREISRFAEEVVSCLLEGGRLRAVAYQKLSSRVLLAPGVPIGRLSHHPTDRTRQRGLAALLQFRKS